MCRPEKPLTTSNKALRALQEWLRQMRERTGLGYRALAVRAGCHATTLQRAASGETVPRLQTVLNYARACDASPDEARLLWKRARYEKTRLARVGRGRPAPRPEFIREFAELGAALVELYEKAGSPPLRLMEQRAGGYGALPRSTAYRIVNKQAKPHGIRQFRAYLRACEVPETEWPGWEAAWTRAWRHEKHEDSAAMGASSVLGSDPGFASPAVVGPVQAARLEVERRRLLKSEPEPDVYVQRVAEARRRMTSRVERVEIHRGRRRRRQARPRLMQRRLFAVPDPEPTASPRNHF
ncbi:helix-turn-helix domain-containing protein [Streptomyces coeruleorubidus]|uniref:helix-turn-helix domain-containing protein n=1 Tax=Streptomyces coeruleorubidus TaxID=116188 RepID=UPI0033C92ADF